MTHSFAREEDFESAIQRELDKFLQLNGKLAVYGDLPEREAFFFKTIEEALGGRGRFPHERDLEVITSNARENYTLFVANYVRLHRASALYELYSRLFPEAPAIEAGELAQTIKDKLEEGHVGIDNIIELACSRFKLSLNLTRSHGKEGKN